MTAARAPFGTRLHAAMQRYGPLCVGVDPHPAVLQAWGLRDDVAGLASFGERMLEAAAGQVAAVKPQAAFFERHGSAGVAVLERLLAAAAEAGMVSVLDVKRGDIGSTMTAYAQAYLGEGSPLAADAVTLSPYLGYESLRPALDLAADTGRGVFVLALTSNPEGAGVQRAGSPSVAARIAAAAAAEEVHGAPLGHVGLVVGATTGDPVHELGPAFAGSRVPVLAPGVGAQGATPSDLARIFAGTRGRVLVPVSRALSAPGPDVTALRARIQVLAGELRDALG